MCDTDDEWLRVCALDALPPLSIQILGRSDACAILLIRTAVGVTAVLDRCGHHGSSLRAVLGSPDACPSGHACSARPLRAGMVPETWCTSQFAVDIRDGWVWMLRSELDEIGRQTGPMRFRRLARKDVPSLMRRPPFVRSV